MANQVRRGGKGHKGTRSARHKQGGKYERQRARTEVNRKRKLLKHFKAHPNDKTIHPKIGSLANEIR